MRQLAQFDAEERARLLADALFADGIENKLEPGRSGGFVVWVRDENDLPRAKALLEELERDPDAPRFAEAAARAKERRRERERADAGRRRSDTVRIRDRWAAAASQSLGPVTTVMIIACVAVAVL